MDSRSMCAAVVELHFRAGNHLARFLWVQTKLHTRPVWEREMGQRKGNERKKPQDGNGKYVWWGRKTRKGWAEEEKKTMSERKRSKWENIVILLSLSCKEPPGVCATARAYCCCGVKTFSLKLQMRDYCICTGKIKQLLSTHETAEKLKCKVVKILWNMLLLFPNCKQISPVTGSIFYISFCFLQNYLTL